MQNDQYKITIYGKNIYREYIVNTNEKKNVRITTLSEGDVRFERSHFFCDFDIRCAYANGCWSITTDENAYFIREGILKSNTASLRNGDSVQLRYADSGADLFRIEIFIDFDCIERHFDNAVNLSDIQEITIGGRDGCNIEIRDSIIRDDFITIRNENGTVYAYDNNTRYGIYVDGAKVGDRAELVNYSFLSFAGYMFFIKNNHMYMDVPSNIGINGIDIVSAAESNSSLKYPKFNRSTRNSYIFPRDTIEVLPPKSKPNDGGGNLLLLIGPSIAMLMVMIVVRGMMNSTGSSFVIYSACTMGITIISSIIGYIVKKRKYKQDLEKRTESYLNYISEKEKEIIEKRRAEYVLLKNKYRAVDKNIEAINNFDKDLFDRITTDEDFLDVRVGSGKRPSINPIKFKPQDFSDEDELASLPEQIAKKYEMITDVPIIANLARDNVLGVIGADAKLYDIFKILLLDLTVRQFYEDLNCVLILPPHMRKTLQWVRWMRHFENEELGIRNIVCDAESEAAIFEYLYSMLGAREEQFGKNKDAKPAPHFVVFVFDSKSIIKHPLFKYADRAAQLGVTFVFFVNYHEQLPLNCTQIIRLENNKNEGMIYDSSASNNVSYFSYGGISDGTMRSAALRMSPVYTDKVSLEGELTKSISLFELLNIYSLNDLNLSKRWAESDIEHTLRAPLGVKTNNEVVYLDLHEDFHGPHGLVAGTTGSGKSEIMQTYILSVATLYHPYEISFVIIDFKGGGMVNQFKKLPHLNGSITNIDGREINRSLRSIKAELRKRQTLFAEFDVNKISDYIRLYKRGVAKIPLPHLILIVDEFAELKMEQPEFMKELISAARIGRSLGVHLILATQKPTGVVDAQIWSNSKFKLCLKVQTREDSQEVLKTPLAAEIVEPGRAYLQVGNNEIFELLQSAYSGVKVPGGFERKNVVELNEVNFWGKRKLVYSNKEEIQDENAKTQLQGVVDYVHDYCESNNIERLVSICLPPLPEEIYSSDIKDEDMGGMSITLGLYDDPDNQIQQPLTLDLQENNMYIIGSAQTGKTSMLQTIVGNLAVKFTPEQVNVYIIDCGNRALKTLEYSRIVGGVALANEEEKIINLFNMLKKEVMNRQNIFSANMVGTYKAYTEAGFKDLPQIFLIIDNVVAFRELYANMDPTLLSIAREGIGAGINVIATGTQTNSISYKILTNFGTRIALSCNDKSEYSNLFDRCRVEPKDVPGRALISMDKRILEFQTALCVAGTTEHERNGELKKMLEMRNEMYGTAKARKIPIVPERMLLSQMLSEMPELYNVKYRIPVGMSFNSIDYIYIDLCDSGLVTVAGRSKSGRTNMARLVLKTISETIFDNLTQAYIFDGARGALSEFDDEGFVEKYTTDSMDATWILEDVYSELCRRRDRTDGMSKDERNSRLEDSPLLLIVIEDIETLMFISKDAELLSKFNAVTEELYEYKACVILSNIENAQPSVSGPSIIRKNVRDKRYAFMLDDIANMKLFETSIQLQRRYPKQILLGEGYLYRNGEYDKIKTILCDGIS